MKCIANEAIKWINEGEDKGREKKGDEVLKIRTTFNFGINKDS